MSESENNQLLKIVCPRCGAHWYKTSLKSFLSQIERAWEPWQKFMTDEQKQRVKQQNNLEKLQATLKKEGYLTYLCEICRLALTLEALNKQNTDTFTAG
jgi:hypothetical protein